MPPKWNSAASKNMLWVHLIFRAFRSTEIPLSWKQLLNSFVFQTLLKTFTSQRTAPGCQSPEISPVFPPDFGRLERCSKMAWKPASKKGHIKNFWWRRQMFPSKSGAKMDENPKYSESAQSKKFWYEIYKCIACSNSYLLFDWFI